MQHVLYMELDLLPRGAGRLSPVLLFVPNQLCLPHISRLRRSLERRQLLRARVQRPWLRG